MKKTYNTKVKYKNYNQNMVKMLNLILLKTLNNF